MDPITQLILQEDELKQIDKSLDTILEGYDLKCQQCGRVITIVKDGQGPLACCNRRMFVIGSQPDDPHSDEVEEVGEGIRKVLKSVVVDPDFQVPVKNVDFSPYNQSDTQKKVKDDRDKKEGDKKQRSVEVHQSELLTTYGGEKKVSEAGFEKKPKGWTDASVKKFGKTLVKGGGKKEGFFKKCVEKMKDKMDNPEGFCASVKDEAHDSTYWRGKDKSPQEVGKDVKKHKNV
jgi:desulfoferrodoxin-like iron-binding protein